MKEWILGIILSIVVIGSYYTAYHTGRTLERRAYTAHFVEEVEAAYWQGFGDGIEKGRIEGHQACLDEEYNVIDRY